MNDKARDLFDVPTEQLHRPGQTTSRDALDATKKSRATMIGRVYDELKKYTYRGTIPEVIAGDGYQDNYALHIELIDVRRAFHVLKKKGLIESIPHPETGEPVTQENPKGHRCVVWRVKAGS